jgi:two-component system chemotaxis response regulator CheB
MIISSLPASFPGSVLVVTHMMADFPNLLEDHLGSNSRLPVTQAVDQEPIRRGHISVARPRLSPHIEAGRMLYCAVPGRTVTGPPSIPCFGLPPAFTARA